jgi:hypothetical protein
VDQRSVCLVLVLMLSGDVAVLQAPMLDSLAFDPFALFYDGFGPAEVGVGWRYVIETLVIAPVVVMLAFRGIETA